jgi:hypothetical protein
MKIQTHDGFENFADDDFDVKAWVDEQVNADNLCVHPSYSSS